MSLYSQKRTCRGCRAWHYWTGGEICDLGYQVEGMAPMEACPKPRSGKEWALLLTRRMQEGKVPSVRLPAGIGILDPVKQVIIPEAELRGEKFDAFVSHMSDLMHTELARSSGIPLNMLQGARYEPD